MGKSRGNNHPAAVCPDLSLNDLFLFRDIYQGLREGREMTDIASRLNVSVKTCRRVLDDVEDALEALQVPGARHGFVRRSAEDPESSRSPAATFHAGTCKILDAITLLVNDCQKSRQRVVIQGSEFAVLWMLPRILAKSGFLTGEREVVLDIKRAYPQRFLNNLEKGRTDLAIGPPAPPRPSIDSTLLLTVNRAIIYPSSHHFRCNAPGPLVRLADLAQETLFVLSGPAVHNFTMEEWLPRPLNPGRRVYVDSISHTYQYVRQGLGVAIAYERRYGLIQDATIDVRELSPDEMPAATFHLYFPKDEKTLSDAAKGLKEAVLAWAEVL